ncbi:MAG: phosphoribosylanthranilate isomerase [Prevotella sp.]|nr:phosphoribosylanthranilate isomerase [Prevotella sp.]
MIIKVCGMRDGENIRQVSALGVNWIGMIFWEQSPRNVTMIPTHAGIIPDRAKEFETSSASGVSYTAPQRVGVFVDEMAQNIITRAVNYRLDIIQLHGHESPTFIRNLRHTLDPDLRPGIRFMKAVSIACADDLLLCKDYEDCVDYFLFDTKCTTVGGSGRQFDWSLLKAYNGQKPFLLSGGIGPDDADRIKTFSHPQCIGIDLNSRFETEPGMKDVEALRSFLSQLKN